MTSKSIYEQRKKDGYCTLCNQPNDRPGFTYCSKCKEFKNGTHERVISKRDEEGKCIYCGNPKEKKSDEACKECLDTTVEKVMPYYINYQEDNCYSCGAGTKGDNIYCYRCKKKYRTYIEHVIETGRCALCGEKRQKYGIVCDLHEPLFLDLFRNYRDQ